MVKEESDRKPAEEIRRADADLDRHADHLQQPACGWEKQDLLVGRLDGDADFLHRRAWCARAAEDDPAAGLTARTALDQAGEIARGGDYRTAMRYLYISALLWLDERNLLRYDRALTNREYLEHLRDNAALRERLRPVVETFDRVWYGHLPLDADSFAAYRAQGLVLIWQLRIDGWCSLLMQNRG